MFRRRKMKTLRFSRTGIIGLLAVLGFLFSATSSFALNPEELQADVTINRVALTIADGSPLSVTIIPPANGNANTIVLPSDAVAGLSAGDFTVTGSEGNTVALTNTAPGCVPIGTATGTVGMSLVTYSPGPGFVIDATSSQLVNWGATFNVTSDASVNWTCTTNVTAAFNP
jgi:hypothetical protein